MIESLKQLDTSLFLWFNSKHNAFFDEVMYWASHEFFWIWFYLILLAMVYTVYKKRTLVILPVIAVMILISDQSADLVKNSVKRYRPCHNTEMHSDIHVNGSCGGQYGFVSSHASNTFALAFFLSMLLAKRFRYFSLLIFLWAALVSYSRIYNGVHYPADVCGGAFLGILSGMIAWMIWKRSDAQFSRKDVP